MAIPLNILYWIFASLVLLVIGSAVVAGLNRLMSASKREKLEVLKSRCRELLLSLGRQTGEARERLLAQIEEILDPVSAEYVALSLPRLEPSDKADITAMFEKTGLVSHFLGLLRSPFKWNRVKAIRVLGEVDLPVASAALYKALDDSDPDVRNVAARALSRLRHPMAQDALVQTLGKHEERVSSRIAAMFIELGAGSVPLLIKNMRNTNWRARFWSAEILGQVGDERAERVLLAALNDSSADVRAAAAKALGKIGGEKAGEQIVPLLKDPEWFVRCHAAWALGELKVVEGVDQLVEALRDKSWWVRKNALEALAKMGETAIPALMATVEGEDRFARESALEALQGLGVEVSTADQQGKGQE